MHHQLLDRLTDHPLRRRAAAAGRDAGEQPDRFGLEEEKVLGFLAGTLSPADEERLAEQVAAALPLGWSLSPRAKERLARVTERLGGEKQLLAWLDAHPGTPRLTARLYALLGTLDSYSADPSVVEALRTARAAEPFPEGLEDELPPETDEETLSDLAFRVERLLGEGRTADATRTARAIAHWLRTVTGPATASGARALGEAVGHLSRELAEAAG